MIDIGIEFYIILSPLVIKGIKEYPTFQKNYKSRAAKGYAYLIMLPVFFAYIGNLAMIEAFENSRFILAITIVLVLCADFLSSLFFKKRVKNQKIEFGSERWFMTRFYRDIIFTILLSIPLLIKFFLFG